ncbi:hypothetical protein GCM10007067_20660 [Lysobacter bugurensis]|uniref:General stress protein n=1 Tax=Cognatilysobacter bugurensis TaxID=543356 RepID=A0A918T0A1_9GAMM|nr:hypothetical protein GCM10007067_20660 [Lysobacter bugurensis]
MASNQNNRGGNAGQSNRGFAGMDETQQRKIAQKGGESVSQNRQHMSAIGRKGGESSRGGGGNRGGSNR